MLVRVKVKGVVFVEVVQKGDSSSLVPSTEVVVDVLQKGQVVEAGR